MTNIKRKAKNSHIKQVVLIIAFLLFCLLIGIISFLLLSKKYTVVSRVNNVKEYAKNDPKDYKTVGWLKVEGTNIDYPVIYGPKFDISKKVDDFVWTEADYNNLNNIIFITGHNILNLSSNPLITNSNHKRFEQLMSFTYLDFVKDNKYIQYTFNGEDYLYKIFAVSYVDPNGVDIYNSSQYSKEELQGYINKALKSSIFDFNVKVNGNDKVISLLTCTRMIKTKIGENYDFKIDARLVRKGELIKNYEVKTNSNYKEIEKYMKGGDADEKA